MASGQLMRQEIQDIPNAIERLLSHGETEITKAASAARALDPRLFLSVARGSSDHVCSYLKYTCELMLRRPMASLGPSVTSVYGVTLEAERALCLSVSQSGQSPDIVRMTETLGRAGAFTVALTNDRDSPLAKTAKATLDIHAGAEKSVAATKTFVTSLVAGLWFLALLKGEAALIGAIKNLPKQLDAARHCDWSPAAAAILSRADGQSLFTLGRGPSWAMSNEAALKFKETCLIHAESYSSAEVLHGPVSIVERGFPILAFAARDAACDTIAATADGLAQKGAQVFATTGRVKHATALDHVRTDHWLTDPIAVIVSFYTMVEAVARARGNNPDRPRHLHKVTETL